MAELAVYLQASQTEREATSSQQPGRPSLDTQSQTLNADEVGKSDSEHLPAADPDPLVTIKRLRKVIKHKQKAISTLIAEKRVLQQRLRRMAARLEQSQKSHKEALATARDDANARFHASRCSKKLSRGSHLKEMSLSQFADVLEILHVHCWAT